MGSVVLVEAADRRARFVIEWLVEQLPSESMQERLPEDLRSRTPNLAFNYSGSGTCISAGLSVNQPPIAPISERSAPMDVRPPY
jgi:hypothetical protein